MITPYALDKMIWLCYTGNLHYLNDGNPSKNKNLKKEFITLLKQNCSMNFLGEELSNA